MKITESFKKYFIIIFLINIFFSVSYASSENNTEIFEAVFKNWTQSFNQREYPKVCDLFSERLASNYQGSKQKNFESTCEGFKKIFLEKNKRYHNDYQLHQVFMSGSLAVVRVTWYLKIFNHGKCESFTQEEGIDIFEKQKNGDWKIVNFIAYPIARHC